MRSRMEPVQSVVRPCCRKACWISLAMADGDDIGGETRSAQAMI